MYTQTRTFNMLVLFTTFLTLNGIAQAQEKPAANTSMNNLEIPEEITSSVLNILESEGNSGIIPDPSVTETATPEAVPAPTTEASTPTETPAQVETASEVPIVNVTVSPLAPKALRPALEEGDNKPLIFSYRRQLVIMWDGCHSHTAYEEYFRDSEIVAPLRAAGFTSFRCVAPEVGDPYVSIRLNESRVWRLTTGTRL